jgi:predicted cupin superfamily sugar epimerase
VTEKAQDIIKALELTPLSVEGGYFNEIYRSPLKNENGDSFGTSIYYMLTENDISKWHKVSKDEIWYYHAGLPAIQLLLYPDGNWEERIIGPDIAKGHLPQSVIPAGVWQAAVLSGSASGSWGLFGAAVFPGFEYKDFESGEGGSLSLEFPSAKDRMKELGLL